MCEIYTDRKLFPLEKVGLEVKQRHSAVLYGIKKFKEKDGFKGNHVLEKTLEKLNSICENTKNINKTYLEKNEILIKELEKSNNEIINLNKQLNKSNDGFLKEIMELNKDEYEEVKKRIKVFISVSKKLNKK